MANTFKGEILSRQLGKIAAKGVDNKNNTACLKDSSILNFKIRSLQCCLVILNSRLLSLILPVRKYWNVISKEPNCTGLTFT